MDNTFKLMYGISPKTIRKTCVIMPFDVPGAAALLGVKGMSSGKIFACGDGKDLTLIRSGMSAGFVGDSILWLKDTACHEIFFLGTCGIFQRKPGLDIGTVLTPVRVYPFESFSAIACGHMGEHKPIHADQTLINKAGLDIPRVDCISFASLHEEAKHVNFFRKLGAEAIEMESAAFFTAARKIARASSALLIASDIVGDKDLCFNLSPHNKKSLAEGISQACKAITNFTGI